MGFRRRVFEAFCYSDDSPVDVIDDTALLIDCMLQCWRPGLRVLKLIAKIRVDLLKIFPMTVLIAVSLTDDEAESGR